jgi:hypothetical protein
MEKILALMTKNDVMNAQKLIVTLVYEKIANNFSKKCCSQSQKTLIITSGLPDGLFSNKKIPILVKF